MGRVGPSGSRATPDCYWSWLRVVLVVVAAAEVKPGEASRLRPGLMAGSSLGSREANSSGVLSRTWTLGMALTEPERLTHKEATMAKPWLCRIGRHRWQRLRNPEGGWYRECRECGKQRNVPGSPPSMAGPG